MIQSVSTHTPVINGNQKVKSLKQLEKDKTNNQSVDNKKWGIRQNSWKPLDFESVQNLVNKGWKETEEVKDKQSARERSAQKSTIKQTKEQVKIIQEDEERELQSIVNTAWKKTEEQK